jgi:hypothetical protein
MISLSDAFNRLIGKPVDTREHTAQLLEDLAAQVRLYGAKGTLEHQFPEGDNTVHTYTMDLTIDRSS